MSAAGDGRGDGEPSPPSAGPARAPSPSPAAGVQPPALLAGAITPPPAIAWQRKAVALLIALIADAPPACLLGESFPVLFDLGVGLALWLALGRSPLLVVALLIECIPGAGLAPTWTAYVVFELIAGRKRAP